LYLLKYFYITGYQFDIDEILNQKTLETLRSWPTDSEISNAIKCGFHQASELTEILVMKKRPESVTYFSSKNGLPDIFDDDDNGFNNEIINQTIIQDEQLELSAALSISASEVLFTISNDLQNADDKILSDCEAQAQLIAMQKKYLCSNYNSMNLKVLIYF